jgi:AraC-like DNA-binding protein
LLAAKYGQPLYLTEVCTAIGVSESTLRVSCNEHLGMGPVRYLLFRRMHMAHRALMLAAPGTATVSKIAMDHGFWEFGRFAAAYRTLFGESPSATLRRSPPDYKLEPNRPFIGPRFEIA